MLEHLLSRGLSEEALNLVAYTDDVATFQLWTITGQPCGYQRYNPAGAKKVKNTANIGKYYTYVTKGYNPIWGVETISKEYDFIFVGEGIFSVAPLHLLGLPAVAILSSDNPQTWQELRLQGKKLYCLADGDKSGKRMASRCNKYILLPDGLDLGDVFMQDGLLGVQQLVEELFNSKGDE